MIKCEYCGTEFEDDLAYCPSCGTGVARHNVRVIGIDADKDGEFEYYQCDDENINTNDFVKISGNDGTFKVHDVKNVDIETVDLEIKKVDSIEKIIDVTEEGLIESGIKTQRIYFKEGFCILVYNKENKNEMKSYTLDAVLMPIQKFFRTIGLILAAFAMVFGVVALIGFVMMIIGSFNMTTFYQFSYIEVTLAVLTLSIAALLKEIMRVNDFKYLKYYIEQRGGTVDYYDLSRFVMEYTINGDSYKVTKGVRNRKVFADRLL